MLYTGIANGALTHLKQSALPLPYNGGTILMVHPLVFITILPTGHKPFPLALKNPPQSSQVYNKETLVSYAD